MRLCNTALISVFLVSPLASAFSSDDLPLTVAHRLVLQAIEQQLPTPRKKSSMKRNLSHANINVSPASCSICYDGNDPYHPGRRLQIRNFDDVVGSLDKSRQVTNNRSDEEPSSKRVTNLTCVEYKSAFLTQLFPEDLSCRAFQGSAADICGCARPPPLCTLCEFGIPPSKPDDEIPARMVGNTEPMTCSDFDKLTHSPFTPSLFLENSAKCSAVRSVGKMYCGCQEPCSFCGKGYRIANPTHPVRDMQNLLDSIVGPFAEDDGPPTCRDVSNAAATALVLFSASSDLASPLDYGIDMETAKGVNEEYICELYRSAFASECNCVKVSTPEKGCNICDNDAFEDPNQSVQVMVDGISVGTTCANVDAFALLGLDVCSEITERHCPCNEAFPATSSSIIADTAPSDEHSSNAETQFDAVGVSLAVSTVIVIVASIL